MAHIALNLFTNYVNGKVVAVYAFQMLCPGCVSHAMAQAKKIASTRYLSTSTGEALHSSFPPTVDT